MGLTWVHFERFVSAITAIGLFWIAWLTLRGRKSSRSRKQGRWEGEVNADIKRFGEFIEEVRQEISKISVGIKEIREGLIARFGRSIITPGSPLRLTDFGKSISKELDAPSWAERMVDAIQGEIEDQEPYTIQVFSFEYASKPENYSSEQDVLIRSSAFNNGLDTDLVRQVVGIELRDLLLERLGLTPP